MILNERLRALRQEKGMSQEQVARALSITLNAYQRLENRDNTPNYANFLRLADFFGVSMDYLAGRTDVREINR